MFKKFMRVQKAGEAGRSMVETLAVLAIIGVLTVGGVMGYQLFTGSNHGKQYCERY